MAGIDETLEFKPVNIAVLTVSDTRTRENDTSGDLLESRAVEAGHNVVARNLLKDSIPQIQAQIRMWANDPEVEAIITTGGTGLTGRDVTVEAVTPMFDKVIDGFSVVFHMKSYETVGLSTLQSRACAGLVGSTIVFCLPGSNGAVKDGWDKVICDQLDSRHKPCNLVELMPRFSET